MKASLFKRAGRWHAKIQLDSWPTERRESLGTTDKRVAQIELEKRLRIHEQVAAGILAPTSVREARERPLESICEAFLSDMRLRDKSTGTLKRYTSALRVVRVEAGWTHLRHVTTATFADWRKHANRRAKTCNDYLAIWTQLLGWLRRQRMVTENPLEFLERMDTAKTAREYRRALTEREALRLLSTAPHPRHVFYRLILETGLRPGEIRRLSTAHVLVARTPAPTAAQGEALGEGRTLAGSGFGGGGAKRTDGESPVAVERSETGSAAVNEAGGSLPPEGAGEGAWGRGPCVRVPSSIAKNRRAALLPISDELAAQLHALLRPDAHPSAPAFRNLVPLCRTFHRDLLAAGIPVHDQQGRRVDLHALRKTFGTHLVLSGADPRVVMEAMRHSDLKLTMKTYMDAAQLAGPMLAAVAKLPWSKATGTAPEKRSQKRSQVEPTTGHFVAEAVTA